MYSAELSAVDSRPCTENDDAEADTDSLFGSEPALEGRHDSDRLAPSDQDEPALTEIPPIPGLYVFPSLLPEDMASKLVQEIAKSDIFCGGQRNQAMLFTSGTGPGAVDASVSQFPEYLQHLASTLQNLVTRHLPDETISTLFHPSPEDASSRQIILNLYRPGEGISPHIDLPGRYADGIIGVCLGSGCVMDFERHDAEIGYQEDGRKGSASIYSVYMPARTVYCMTGAARWSWAHGIPSRDRDLVVSGGKVVTILRDVRISITLRWMKPGAEVLR